MRIIVNGQQAFGQKVLESLLERGEEVVGVYCGPDKEGARPDPLKEAAQARDLPVLQPRSFKKPEVWKEMAALRPDLCVMAYVTLFVPEQALNVPTHGTIQYHPSLLPLHRGPSSINWPIMWGEEKTGLSIFWPDNGLDTGPLLIQKEVPIRDDDTLGSLYFDSLFPLGVEAMLAGVDLVKAGNPPRIEQDHSSATYEGWCRHDDAEIDWSKPRQEVWNLIRGTNPQPGAWTRFAGEELFVFDARKEPATAGAAPGEVVSVSDDGIRVAAGGGDILAMRVRPAKGKKVPGAEYAAAAKLAAGAKLG